MTRQAEGPGWPLFLWGAQLIPAIFVVLFAVLRIVAASGAQSVKLNSLLLLVFGTAWFFVAAQMLFSKRGRRWLVRHRFAWGLSATTTIICLLIADLALTLTGVVPTISNQRAYSIAYTFGRFSSYRMVPKDIQVDSGAAIHINQRGFRGPEFSAIKEPGKIRMAFLGGSQVFDYQGQDWPKLVEQELTRRGHNVEVINAGVPGQTSTDSLAKLLTDIWLLDPDIVFACQGWNDIKYFKRVNPHEPYRGLPPHEPVSWQKDWRMYPSGLDAVLTGSAVYRLIRGDLLEFLITEEGLYAMGAGAGPIHTVDIEPFGPWGPRQFSFNLNLIVNQSRQIGAEPIFCKQAHLLEGTTASGFDTRDYINRNTGLTFQELKLGYDAIYQTIDDIALREELLVVDMNTPLSINSENFWDPIHFNPKGSVAASKIVADSIDSYLLSLRQE